MPEREGKLPGVAFDLDRIRKCCCAKTVRFEPVVDSTNDWAIESGRAGVVSLPALFLTSEQTRGRGRGVNLWVSSKGSLTFSLLVKRPVPIESVNGGLVALIAADAICETIVEICGLLPAIKWPNDVYLNDRKLAGILIESVGTTMLVIGCGVNVSNPTDEPPLAINLACAMPMPPSMDTILCGIVQRLIKSLSSLDSELNLGSSGYSGSSTRNALVGGLLHRCRKRDWLLGRLIEHRSASGTLIGTSSGFSDDGGMIMEIEGKEMQIVRTGSISVL